MASHCKSHIGGKHQGTAAGSCFCWTVHPVLSVGDRLCDEFESGDAGGLVVNVRVPATPVRLTLLLLLLLLHGCGSEPKPLLKGELVPAFQLERLDGGVVVYPSDPYQGRVVIIDFWADWCALCRDELINHQRLVDAFRDQGLSVLAINIEQDQKTARAFIERLPQTLSYDVLLDIQGETARRYGVLGLPVTYVIDREGYLSTKILGGSEPGQLQKVVSALLQ
ncbi:MAG: TlpA family protein disulfide reductase [Sedimenticola thiotaurini]|uniref:TlpA family protein disulfide reductase n=1 Tax=Sedimenticola thiotaurini TaxID=1543721 RepID=A0A558D0V7_9GAMM|nr:MAG: TlpA family protein disulfide reductase [Sedimenticola thiotaurini]